ncbi:MAG: DNA topoisomerase III [Defluviitaleaceae bacterium]|nr:DNA topoisomerase III [Defluviitaleaceae bacterium]
MSKTLVITEKPSVANDIAKVLGARKKGDGFLFSDTHIISWAIGHLITLADPEDYDSGLKKWNFSALPIIPESIKLKPNPKTKKQLDVLKKLMNDKAVTEIVCATDSGREGELIFRYIYEYVKCKKTFSRLWISSMTDEAIKKGFESMKPSSEYDNLFYSARCRSEADWLVGINASRAYTLKFNSLLSIGRVQTPTLAIIVNRQNEINNFVPKDYWQIKANFGEYFGTWFNKEDNENKIFEKEKAEEIYAKILNQDGKIESIKNEKKTVLPGLLYDLTLLQRECNRKFGYAASKTLEIAQSLYEKRKLITYPRTDSQYLSEDMIPKIHQTLDRLDLEPYSGYISYLKGLEKLPITKRIVDSKKVTDHHAIIPTDKRPNLSGLSPEEFNVYDMVARKFIAAFYPSYIYNVTKIVTVVLEESFLTQGNTVIQLGFKEVFKDDSPKKGEEDAVLPNVKKGDTVNCKDAEVLAKKTQPPKLYDESNLLSAMENAGRFVDDETLKEQLKDSGIGTPATRAAIIERIIQVGYVERKGKSLIPTEKGMKLIAILPTELVSPETTGKWEKGLNSIAKGNMESVRFMGSIARYVNYIIDSARTAENTVSFPEDKARKKKQYTAGLGKCPVCSDGTILENSKGYYCTRFREGCKMTIWKDSTKQYGLTLEPKLIKEILAKKVIENIEIILPQTGEKCTASLHLEPEQEPKIQIKNVNRNN